MYTLGIAVDDEVARSAAFQRVTFSITVDHIVSVSPFDVNRGRFLYSYSFIC